MKNTTQALSRIPFDDFGGEGPVLVFAHANGFPPGAYRRFLEPFTRLGRVIAIRHRPLWQEKPDAHSTWHQVRDDLIAFLDTQNLRQVIGMGHSMGGVATMLAAARRPDLFSRLVLIEPVFIPSDWQFIFRLLPNALKQRFNPMIKGALRRQDFWKDQAEVFKSWRRARAFARVSDEVLWDYVRAGTTSTDGGFRLAYSKYWEANYYGRIPRVWPDLRQVRLPTLGIRGQFSDTIFPKAWKKWAQCQPHAVLHTFEGAGHLIPMEAPDALAAFIIGHLQNADFD
ncbi:MAG: alpha/beta hydrolase [Bacteroidetes bacterium]|nr:MAG: alpha/beta hydrolase [Bacteroidota bacterium]